MNYVRAVFVAVAIIIVAIAFNGCGGGGGGVPAVQQPASFVRLQSDPGDFIGGGQTFTYTNANAVIKVTAVGGYLSVIVEGDEYWMGDFLLPQPLTTFQPGTFTGLGPYPNGVPAVGELTWTGNGHGGAIGGSFTVESVTYESDKLTAIDLSFDQQSSRDSPAALHGKIRWNSLDTTTPPGPVYPVPGGLWQPAPGSTPSTGNYVYLQSETGDPLGAGKTHTFGPSEITVKSTDAILLVNITVPDLWRGAFQAMNTLDKLQPGYYGDVDRWPGVNPAKGALSWDGRGIGCNTVTGWFVVDDVRYDNGVLTAVDLRFEQHCDGIAPALHGKLHWIK